MVILLCRKNTGEGTLICFAVLQLKAVPVFQRHTFLLVEMGLFPIAAPTGSPSRRSRSSDQVKDWAGQKTCQVFYLGDSKKSVPNDFSLGRSRTWCLAVSSGRRRLTDYAVKRLVLRRAGAGDYCSEEVVLPVADRGDQGFPYTRTVILQTGEPFNVRSTELMCIFLTTHFAGVTLSGVLTLWGPTLYVPVLGVASAV